MKISYMKCYGKACYELSGERSWDKDDFRDFILDILRIDKWDEEDPEVGYKIPMPIRYELVDAVLSGGFGDSYGISYDCIKLDKDDVKKRELLKIFNDIYITYDKMDELRNRKLDKYLEM